MEKEKKIKKFDAKEIVTRNLAIVIFLIIWEILPRAGIVNRTFMPPMSEILIYTVNSLYSGDLQKHVIISLSRSFTGFALAIGMAIPLGFALGWFNQFERYLDSLIQTFRQTTVFALFPLFILFFGIGEVSKIAIIFYGSMWPILLNTISGVKNVDPLLVKSARSMGVSRIDLFRKVVIPAAFPTIFTGIRLGATFSIMIIVAAEMMGASSGLGYILINSQYNFDILRMYSAIITLAVIGLMVNYILVWFERRTTAWKEDALTF
jgi:NitT/TauT family transport system permease protein